MALRTLPAALLLTALAGATALAQEVVKKDGPVKAGAGLFCVDRKCATPEKVGLYLRTREGAVRRVWEGEPYDARLLPDGRCVVVERWTGRVVLLNRERQTIFEKKGLEEPVDVE